jgi:proteic killer suppression protein
VDVEFANADLDGLETEPEHTCGFAREIVRGFRKAMQAIRAAQDERDLYVLRGLRFEKLKGARSHQYSVRINKQWRLIMELESEEPQKEDEGSKEGKKEERQAPKKKAKIVAIEDYH